MTFQNEPLDEIVQEVSNVFHELDFTYHIHRVPSEVADIRLGVSKCLN